MKNHLTLIAATITLTILFTHNQSFAQTTTGSWTLYPAQTTHYSVLVQPPIKLDGTTIVRSHQVPIKFHLFEKAGLVVFQSILSDGEDESFPGTNDFSFLSFAPDPTFNFNQLFNLKTDYSYLMGNCGGGALRWSVRIDVNNDGDTTNDGSVFIYYGSHPNFDDCASGASQLTGPNQSGQNLISAPDLRYDLSQFGGPWYGSHADAIELVGDFRVLRASLVVDSGWFDGDDKLSISNIMVNDNTFAPMSGPPVRTCGLPPATIKITKLASTPVGNPISVQPPKNDSDFRIVDCMYIYNLDTDALPGSGVYKVEVVINGNTAAGSAVFTIP